MVGGQVLIIFVGGEAFKITPLNGKEWGLSIGLGAISVPWGAVIRTFPDAWAAAMAPHFQIPLPNIWPFKGIVKKRRATAAGAGVDAEKPPLSEEERHKITDSSDSDAFEAPEPPLRTLTSIRGRRATTHIRRGFREYMHDQKTKVKVKAKVIGGSKTDVSSQPQPQAPGLGGKLPGAAA